MQKNSKKGAEIIWECLERLGVEYVFGYPGGAILPAYDAMTHYGVHHVLVGTSKAPRIWRTVTRARADA